MGKQRVIAETGAGQHGVATATACASHFGLQCVIYMGEEDIRRQRPNVFSMKLLGAEVRPVTSGSKTLRDAVNEAFRDWMSSVGTTHFCVGSVIGPHPFPRIVRDFQSVIGREARAQSLEQIGRLPDTVVACVGRRQQLRPAGMFYPFIEDSGVELVGVEAGGRSGEAGEITPPRFPSAGPACCTARSAMYCRTTTARLPTYIAFPPDSITRAPVPSTAIGKTPAACDTRTPATMKSSMLSTPWRGWKGFCRRWRVRTHYAVQWRSPPRASRMMWSWYVFPAVETRMRQKSRG